MAGPSSQITEGFKVIGNIYGNVTPVRNFILGGTVAYGDLVMNSSGTAIKATGSGVGTGIELIGVALEAGVSGETIPVACCLPGTLLSCILDDSGTTGTTSAASQRNTAYSIETDGGNGRQFLDAADTSNTCFVVLAFDESVVVGTTTRPKCIVTPIASKTIFGA